MAIFASFEKKITNLYENERKLNFFYQPMKINKFVVSEKNK
jgi:hypothetical protein